MVKPRGYEAIHDASGKIVGFKREGDIAVFDEAGKLIAIWLDPTYSRRRTG